MAKNDDWVDVPLSPSNDDWHDIPIESMESPYTSAISKVNSALRGGLQGLTFGMADEMHGLTQSPIQSLMETLGLRKDDGKDLIEQYKSFRDSERTENKKAELENPDTYLTGDIAASVIPGLATGGVGLLGSGLKVGAKEAIKKGGTKALMALGAAEGATHGLGRSEADLTEGDVLGATGDTVLGAGIGIAAPAVMKGAGAILKGGLGLTDDVLSNTPGAKGVYGKLKDLYTEGTQNVGKSLDETAQGALDDLHQTAKKVKDAGLSQHSKYENLLEEAKNLATKTHGKANDEFVEKVNRHAQIVGKDIGNQDIKVYEALQHLPNQLAIVDGELALGKFMNFRPMMKDFEAAAQKMEGRPNKQAILQVFKDIETGDYFQVSEAVKRLNSLIEEATPYEKTFLPDLKKGIQNTINTHLQQLDNHPNVPADLKNVFKKRLDLNKDYHLLSNIKEQFALDPGATASQKAFRDRTTSFIGQPSSPEGFRFGEALNEARQTGIPELIDASDNLTSSAQKFNKLNVKEPEMGKMGLGPDESLASQYSDLFGSPKETGLPAKMSKTLHDLSKQSNTVSKKDTQENFIKYVRETFPEEADALIDQFKKQSSRVNTLDAGLDDNVVLNQDFSSQLRAVKKFIDPITFAAGKGSKHLGNIKKSASDKGLNQATTYRALTQPQAYKTIVEQFKNSQDGESQVE